jgi:NitT/TauT family transport system substrate-binding protein
MLHMKAWSSRFEACAVAPSQSAQATAISEATPLKETISMRHNQATGFVKLIAFASAVAFAGAQLAIMRHASAAESVTYLFPAPPSLPAFAPIRLAKGKGYFEQAGIDVNFAMGRGGVDVAKQVGAGNAPWAALLRMGPSWSGRTGSPRMI